MFKAAWSQYEQLRPSIKAMLYLHWIYTFVGTLTGVFTNIFFYQHFRSVLFNIFATMIFFTGICVGFSLVGLIASRYRMNMKRGYLVAFFALCLSFLLLSGDVSRLDAELFMLVNGFGIGLYWVTLHTFELTETKDHERDFYSSILSAGDQVVTLLAPAFATVLFYLSDNLLHIGTFTLLFVFAPLMYLLGIPLFRHIGSYRPTPIELADFLHFLKNKTNMKVQPYLFANSADYAIASIVLPLSALIFLGSEKHVGIFNTMFAVISALVLVALSRVRHSGNRMRFLFVTTCISAAITFALAVHFTLGMFILYSLILVIVHPLQRVSEHVIDLQTMETLGRAQSDFFPTMIFRDAAFALWRICILAVFALVTVSIGAEHVALQAGFAIIAAASLLIYYGATLVYQK